MSITFANATGEQLSGHLDVPVHRKPVAYALFAHCFTCSKDLKAVQHISQALTAEGLAVLRFDFTGLGQSGGEFAETNFSSNVSDLVHAARFLEAEYGAPAMLIGHSLGGAAVLQAAKHLPSVRGVATIGAPAEARHVTHLFDHQRAEIEADGEAEVELAGRTFKVKKQLIEDLETTRMRETVRALNRALLILHSPIDHIVGVENAAALFKAAKHPKSFVSLDTADHLLTNPRDSHYAGVVIAAWVRKYLDPSPATVPSELDEARVVVRTGREHYRTEVLAGPHMLLADEPEAVGGTDTGPTPYDLLVAALGTCTSITLRMYADRKAWPLDEIIVRLSHKKVHAKACDDCQTKQGKIDQIEREIELRGNLDETQRARLLEIADRCPVHRTLYAEAHVKTQLRA